jgi:hypothetical protein
MKPALQKCMDDVRKMERRRESAKEMMNKAKLEYEEIENDLHDVQSNILQALDSLPEDDAPAPPHMHAAKHTPTDWLRVLGRVDFVDSIDRHLAQADLKQLRLVCKQCKTAVRDARSITYLRVHHPLSYGAVLRDLLAIFPGYFEMEVRLSPEYPRSTSWIFQRLPLLRYLYVRCGYPDALKHSDDMYMLFVHFGRRLEEVEVKEDPEVHCSWSFQSQLSIVKCPNLKSLVIDISGEGVPYPDIMEFVTSLPHLEKVRVATHYHSWSDRTLDLDLSALSKLTHLELHPSPNTSDTHFLRSITVPVSLKFLLLDVRFSLFAPLDLSPLTALMWLGLGCMQPTPVGWETLQALTCLTYDARNSDAVDVLDYSHLASLKALKLTIAVFSDVRLPGVLTGLTLSIPDATQLPPIPLLTQDLAALSSLQSLSLSAQLSAENVPLHPPPLDLRGMTSLTSISIHPWHFFDPWGEINFM